MDNGLRIIAFKEFKYDNEIYKIVDFINKSIVGTDIVLGLTQKNNKSIITVYKES